MRKIPRLAKRILSPLLVLSLLTLVIFGCSDYVMPTKTDSMSEHDGLWNPNPGDQNGNHEVPILDDSYWESQGGNTINPWLAQPIPALIGPLGGTVSCGSHHLYIPAGALLRTVGITMTYASSTGVGVDCGPGGLQFLLPVTLSLSYAGTQYDINRNDQADPSVLRVYYVPQNWDGDFSDLDGLPSTVDEHAMTVTTQINHFSRYIIG